jgi:putative membrane protein
MAAQDDRQKPQAEEKIAESAEVLEETTVQQTGSADRRTELAADRTVLAAERTYTAWIRTGLAALASGVGAQALLEGVVPAWLSLSAASALILFSSFCFAAAVWRELYPGAPPPRPDTKKIPPAVLIVVNGFLIFVSFMALLGIWIAR